MGLSININKTFFSFNNAFLKLWPNVRKKCIEKKIAKNRRLNWCGFAINTKTKTVGFFLNFNSIYVFFYTIIDLRKLKLFFIRFLNYLEFYFKKKF